MSLANSIKELDKHSEKLNDELVDFFKGLWETQEAIEAIDWEPKTDLTELRRQAALGTPIFSVESPGLSAKYLTENLVTVANYVASRVADFKAVADKINELSANGAVLPFEDEVLEKAFFATDELVASVAELVGVDMEDPVYGYLNLAVVSTLEPSAAKAAAKLDLPESSKGDEDGAYCPVCGLQSPLGLHEDAGASTGSPRFMWCSFCDIKFPYPRMRCTRCGNNNQEDVSYRYAEGDESHRIYFDTKCGGTQKIVAEVGLMYIPDPRVEDLLMLDLEQDVWAALDEEIEAASN